MDDVDVRARALSCASRAVEPGSPVGHFLSTARLFARYISIGLSQTGPGNRQSIEVHDGSVTVRVEGLTELNARLVTRAVRDAL